jgi:hypothetical protein
MPFTGCPRESARGVLLAALLLLALAAAGDGAPARPRPPAAASSPAATARAARYRRPTGEEMAQFYAEFRRRGWLETQIAPVTTAYAQSGSLVLHVDAQFATFSGDVDGDGADEWVVGCYFLVRPAPGADPLAQDDRARVVVFKEDNAALWRAHWRSPGLGYEFSEPEFNVEEVARGLDDVRHLLLPLSLQDVDGDASLEIVYHCRSHSPAVGGLPGVLRYDGARWVSVAPQGDRFSLRDLDGDRRMEVVTGSRRIGHGSGDDDVPRVWRWRDRQYREASAEFPQFYANLAIRYTECVRRMEQRAEMFNRAAWERAIQKAVTLSGKPAVVRPPAPRPPA